MRNQQFATHSAELTVNADGVRTEELHGREHIVASATLVREMVLKGEFLPFDEIRRGALAWNGSPVTVTHPRDDDGEFLPASARADEFERHAVGHVFGADADADRRALDGEVWLDRERAAQTAAALDRDDPAGMLLDGETIEVSTGYWYRKTDDAGTYDGTDYSATQADVQPDHLATLPNGEGECSISDGCGAGRPTAGAAAADGGAEPILYRIAHRLGIETEADDGCDCGGSCDECTAGADAGDGDGAGAQSGRRLALATNDGESNDMTTYDTEDIAEQSGVSEETLEAMDDDEYESLAEAVIQQDDDGGDPDPEGADPEDTDGGGGEDTDETASAAVLDEVQEMRSEFQTEMSELREKVEAQEVGADRDELVATIQTHADDLPEEDLEEMSLSALKTLADNVSPAGGVYAGRAGAAGDGGNEDLATGVSLDDLGGDD